MNERSCVGIATIESICLNSGCGTRDGREYRCVHQVDRRGNRSPGRYDGSIRIASELIAHLCEVVLNHNRATSDIGRKKGSNPMTASDFAIQYGAASVEPFSIGVNKAVFKSRLAAHEFCRWLNCRHYTSFMTGRAIYFFAAKRLSGAAA